ncbi:MAG: beta-N-acetylhexosaminidase [bacterium]
MHTLVKSFLMMCLVGAALPAESGNPATDVTSPTSPALIPLPQQSVWREGRFQIGAKTPIVAAAALKGIGDYLAEQLAPASGQRLEVKTKASASGAITLALDPGRGVLGNEGYELDVTPKAVRLTAAKPAGLFYGVQTLRQLLDGGTLPAVAITDWPRFVWRGLLLDEGRHFQGKEFVKRYIDYLAYHKLNVLHWHLTEDQGWRIEIKKYPKLTEVGAWREQGEGKRYGGFYTQDEVREVVAYAASRYVTVVPEIEMPGHSLGALASYPEFSCTGGPFKVRPGWGIEKNVYCAGNEATFAFLKDVLDEVLALFPSAFIHIGGDECPKERWKECPKCQARIKAEGLKGENELQSYFIRRIEAYLDGKGRRLIGWDEILEGGLAPKATVMSWRGMGGAQAAAQSGHDYVATPTSHCYLDYPLGRISLEKAYSLDPIPSALTPEQQRHCLGLQGNIWGEGTPKPADVDRMTWPRLCALAEVGWSSPAGRDFTNFCARLDMHADRLAAMGLSICAPVPRPVVGTWTPDQMSVTFKTLDWNVTPHVSGAGNYDVELSYSGGQHGVATEWVALLQDGAEVARDTHAGFAGGNPHHQVYRLTLPAVKAGAIYTLRTSLRSDGGTDSRGDVRMRRK